MDTSTEQADSSAQIQQLAHQVAQQQALLQQLLVAQDQAPALSATELHDLPTRPRYDWQPNQLLFDLMPTLGQPVFGDPLSDDDRKTIVDRYPPVTGISYSPPAILPQAESQFKPGHRREDASLRSLQYASSTILHPLDVLVHTLLPLLPQEHYGCIFTIINNVRSLVLHVAGVANQSRNQLALRAVNPSFSIPNSDKSFTMSLEQFKDTVANHTAMCKALRDARPSGGSSARRSADTSCFRGVPPLGGGGQPVSNFRSNPANHQQQGRHNHNNHHQHQQPNNNPFRNLANNGSTSRQ